MSPYLGLDCGTQSLNAIVIEVGRRALPALHDRAPVRRALPAVRHDKSPRVWTRNREILQVMADVFGAPVHRNDVPNAACLGAYAELGRRHAALEAGARTSRRT